MIELGKSQTLKVVKTTINGVYLNADDEPIENKVLLPKNQVPKNLKMGDTITVFIYKDSEDRPIATTTTPLIELHQLAVLEVVETGTIGAFLNWGLSKDLLLPFKEQTKKVEKGDKVLVCLYIDKSKRLCATMRIYSYLSTNHSYSKNEHVSGIVYQINKNLGAFVALDNKYFGLIPNKELFSKINVGDMIEARITGIREDGKCYLSLREKSYKQMDMDSKVIYEHLVEANGFLPLHDKSNPETIKKELGLSKASFKRAVGRLLKEGKITLTEQGIQIKENK